MIKGKKTHTRRHTEFNTKANPNNNDTNTFDNSVSNEIFGRAVNARRRLNVNFEKTMDFLGISNNNHANNTMGGNNQSPGAAVLFRTLHANSIFGNQNYQSAEMAMEGDSYSGGFSRSSFFGIPRRQNSTFHSRHASVTVNKTVGKHFDTEGESQFNGLEENKESSKKGGMTFDERNKDQNHKRSSSMFSSFDQSRLK